MAARHPRPNDDLFAFTPLSQDPLRDPLRDPRRLAPARGPRPNRDPDRDPDLAPGERSRRGAATQRHHGYRGAVVTGVLLAGVAAIAWAASTEVIEAGGRALGWLEAHNSARGRTLLTILCATVAALALTLAWGRETSERRPVRLAGGRARMAVDEVAATLREALLEEVALADAEVRVANLHRRGLRVSVRADVEPRARIDETVEAVDGVVAEVVLDGLGSRLAARPAVDVRYRELDLRWSDGSVGRG